MKIEDMIEQLKRIGMISKDDFTKLKRNLKELLNV